MYQSHRWQEQIKIETITSLKNMLTAWLAKHDKSVLIIFLNLAVTFMLSIRQLLTCAFQSFGGRNSAKRKVVSKCIHYMMWKHRFLHSFISRKHPYTILKS